MKTKQVNGFKYFIYGILSLFVILIIGIIVLQRVRGEVLPDALTKESVSQLAEDIYTGENNDAYYVYFYYPGCGACQNFMESTTYQNYVSHPNITMYKINVYANEESYALFTELNLQSTPTLFYIKKVSEDKYQIKKVTASNKAINLLDKYS